jgi:ABC-type multidrug transport system fused ATPase/permease subunit
MELCPHQTSQDVANPFILFFLGTVPRQDVRKRLNAIPQEPFFLPGSLRDNIDPLKCADDERIVSILIRLGLWDALQNNDGGLVQTLDLDTLSHGQRQLLCFARAVIRPGQIVIMDEVTAR